jgi:hypothetical protein
MRNQVTREPGEFAVCCSWRSPRANPLSKADGSDDEVPPGGPEEYLPCPAVWQTIGRISSSDSPDRAILHRIWSIERPSRLAWRLCSCGYPQEITGAIIVMKKAANYDCGLPLHLTTFIFHSAAAASINPRHGVRHVSMGIGWSGRAVSRNRSQCAGSARNSRTVTLTSGIAGNCSSLR